LVALLLFKDVSRSRVSDTVVCFYDYCSIILEWLLMFLVLLTEVATSGMFRRGLPARSGPRPCLEDGSLLFTMMSSMTARWITLNDEFSKAR